MTSEEILKEMASLPAEARNEIEDFIARIRVRYSSAAKNAKTTPLDEEGFVGMWRGRDDMADSTAWVRNLREKHWAN